MNCNILCILFIIQFLQVQKQLHCIVQVNTKIYNVVTGHVEEMVALKTKRIQHFIYICEYKSWQNENVL